MQDTIKPYCINSSNSFKINEFKRYLGEITVTTQAIQEPDSDAITIIRYKSSQFENVLTDDSSLEIEGESVGANIKWLLSDLPKHIGKKAIFICLLAIKKENVVFIYKGQVKGTIVSSRGKQYGFLSYFQPDGAIKTLAEERPDYYNARFYAIQNFLENKPYTTCSPLYTWQGPFQKD